MAADRSAYRGREPRGIGRGTSFERLVSHGGPGASSAPGLSSRPVRIPSQHERGLTPASSGNGKPTASSTRTPTAATGPVGAAGSRHSVQSSVAVQARSAGAICMHPHNKQNTQISIKATQHSGLQNHAPKGAEVQPSQPALQHLAPAPSHHSTSSTSTSMGQPRYRVRFMVIQDDQILMRVSSYASCTSHICNWVAGAF